MNDDERDAFIRAFLTDFLVEIEVELMFVTDDHARVVLWAARDGFTARLTALDAGRPTG